MPKRNFLAALSFAVVIIFNSFLVHAQRTTSLAVTDLVQNRWVDSVYNSLSIDERIGQLFMVAAYSGGKDYNEERIKTLVSSGQVGGLIFMQGDPVAQAMQNNQFQRMSKVPLLIGMDAEWGLGMRLTGVKDLPRQMMIGATHERSLAYKMGVAVAKQCNRLGVHIDFAPVVDVNNNPDNPIINARSFGEDKHWVSALGTAYMRGLQDNGVMACAKHFPGHGDTKTDSHKDMPVINKSMRQLDTLELFPFKELIKNGVQSVMVAHLEVPAIEPAPRVPTTLSKNTITGLLKGQMGFKGLVFTDALNMEGVAKYYKPGEVDLRAFQAGNDVLLFSQDVPTAIARIHAAIDSGEASEKQLETSVKKILAAKYTAGLAQWKPVDVKNVTADINKNTFSVREQMATAAVTLVRDRNKILDDLFKDNIQIGYIGVNTKDSTVLLNGISGMFPSIKTDWLPKHSSSSLSKRIADAMADNDINIVAVHSLSFYPSGGNYGLDEKQISFIKQASTRNNTLIIFMGNAYLLRNICDVRSAIVAYEDDSVTQSVVANVLMGTIKPAGSLPVTPCTNMRPAPIPVTEQVSAKTPAPGAKLDRLQKVDFAEDAGVKNSVALEKLNMFIQRSIADGAFPGCRILAAKDGKVFYDEAFGYFTYSKGQKVDKNTIYDIASVTKVAATTLAVMRLYETGKISLDKKLGDYLAWTRGTDKADLRLRDLLLHQAGLKSWIPFYKETLDAEGNPRGDLYSDKKQGKFTMEVARGLFLRNDYTDTIWNTILTSPLENKGKYVYSDLDFYFLAAVVKQVTGQRIDKYVEEQFYKPLGLKQIAYNPLDKFRIDQVAPTEHDALFRHQLITGYVHDQGAAMFGGVEGHAGIFASAHDVAVLFQLLLNKGTYNGKRYFKKETVDYFTAYNSKLSRRGLGFDKPAADKNDAGPAGNRVSGHAFGHQGFTGTCAWADPQTGIVFIFLSNRVYPSADNGKINRSSIRTVAQDYIYEAFGIEDDRQRPEVYRLQVNNGR